jgi:hypothetical protein
MNAAIILELLAPRAAGEVMQRLVGVANVRIRLIASGYLVATDLGHVKAGAVLIEALSDPPHQDMVGSRGSVRIRVTACKLRSHRRRLQRPLGR